MSQTKTKKKNLKGTTIRFYFRSLESFSKLVKECKNPIEDQDEQEDSKLTENGLLFCRWSLGRPKTLSGDVFGHTDSIGSFKRIFFLRPKAIFVLIPKNYFFPRGRLGVFGQK